MKAIIQKKKILEEVHSASGMEYLNGKIYIIGDDSPFLYLYDADGIFLRKELLFIPATDPEERIPKAEKPDLEMLTLLSYGGKDYLLTLGSGSKKDLRDKGFLIDVLSLEVSEVSLAEIYNSLQSDKTVVGKGKLNVEGLCATDKEIILLVRGNISELNITLTYNLKEFLGHLLKKEKAPSPKIAFYSLPSVEGWLSGFSGADYSIATESILFVATVEKTLNEIDDGETIGSFVGEIPVKSARATANSCPIMENGEVYKGKVESISILNSGKTITALAVTDSDGGVSELLWLEIDNHSAYGI